MAIEASIGNVARGPVTGISSDPRMLAKSAIMCAIKGYRQQFGHPFGGQPVVLDHCILSVNGQRHNLGELPAHQADMEAAINLATRDIFAPQ